MAVDGSPFSRCAAFWAASNFPGASIHLVTVIEGAPLASLVPADLVRSFLRRAARCRRSARLFLHAKKLRAHVTYDPLSQGGRDEYVGKIKAAMAESKDKMVALAKELAHVGLVDADKVRLWANLVAQSSSAPADAAPRRRYTRPPRPRRGARRTAKTFRRRF